MNLLESLITNVQASELMKPGDRALDNPAGFAQPRSMLGSASSNLAADSTRRQLIPMGLRIVAAIRLNQFGTLKRPATFAGDRWYSFNQPHQLCHIVPVGFSQYYRKWGTLSVGENVVLAPRLTAICWVRSGFFSPCTA